MAKITKKPINNLRLTTHEGYRIFVQHVVADHVFQYLVFKDEKIYHDWIQLTPQGGHSKKLSQDEVVKAGAVVLDMAIATVEVLKHKDNPNELTKDKGLAVDVVNALENANKPVQKMVN